MSELSKDLPVLALVGPTASGKSDIAFKLCQHYPLEIINIDSLQVYKHMNIGTAKPTEQELSQCPNHLFNFLNPDQSITAQGYAEKAKNIINQIHQKDHLPLLVGGSGFYLQALSNDKSFPAGTIEDDSIENLYTYIQRTDLKIAQQIHKNDSYRIRRIAFLIKHDPQFSWADYTSIGRNKNILSYAVEWPRETLYQRINQRVVDMFTQGIVKETKNLLEQFPDCKLKLKKTIGYAQCLKHLEDDFSYEEAIENTQQKTRNYAKRQTTWFKNRGHCQQFAYPEIFDKLCSLVETLCHQNGIKR